MRKLILTSAVAVLALTGAALAQPGGPKGPHGNNADVNASARGYVFNRQVTNTQAANGALHIDTTVARTQSGGSSWTVNGAHTFQSSAVNGVAAANSTGKANQSASSSYENNAMRGAAAGSAQIEDQGGFAQVGNVVGTSLTPTTGSAQGSTSGGFSGGGSYTNTNQYTGSINASGSYNATQTHNASGYGASGSISYRN
ncbi:hypothetical protein [Microvirga pakistanensis]|uniref:hypothetical protein n=1 Tax=Microvirga pakistanensis TaxID=1682650 RepID=UPI00106C89DE|nr:hypothetical protein [Microvirga pakistanensis]